MFSAIRVDLRAETPTANDRRVFLSVRVLKEKRMPMKSIVKANRNYRIEALTVSAPLIDDPPPAPFELAAFEEEEVLLVPFKPSILPRNDMIYYFCYGSRSIISIYVFFFIFMNIL